MWVAEGRDLVKIERNENVASPMDTDYSITNKGKVNGTVKINHELRTVTICHVFDPFEGYEGGYSRSSRPLPCVGLYAFAESNSGIPWTRLNIRGYTVTLHGVDVDDHNDEACISWFRSQGCHVNI